MDIQKDLKAMRGLLEQVVTERADPAFLKRFRVKKNGKAVASFDSAAEARKWADKNGGGYSFEDTEKDL